MSGAQNKKQFKDETLREVEISFDDIEVEKNIDEEDDLNWHKNEGSI